MKSAHRPSRSGRLWAITSYFNPIGYRRRLSNYRQFRRQLTVPLLTVELAFDKPFELVAQEADRLLQVRGRDVLWQKERLLNLALDALPGECEGVAGLDCDLMFASPDWAGRAMELVDQVPLVQLFRQVHYLDRDWQPDQDIDSHTERTRWSLASGVCSGMTPSQCMQHPGTNVRMGTYANGLAWAGRRSLLERHRFYDARILGGGDRALACAAYGCPELMIERHELDAAQARHYRDWADPFCDSVAGNVAFLDTTIHHLWHGEVANRRLDSRQKILRECHFDPGHDIAVDQNGCWRWNREKPELQRRVREYFADRKEDG